ncbi:MAG: hypothetical protein PHN44_01305 [Candidatus Marinimicrobia bacterium]|nr:hypothetical protein [Candidatus Neomarinimicrobiota bacterium]
MPAVNIAPYIRNQYFTSSGVPLAGGLLNVYEAGTSTRKTTYSDAAGTTANANPIVLDSAGRFAMYMATGAHKFVLTDSASNVIWTEDNVTVSSVVTDVNTVASMKELAAGAASIIRTIGRLSVNDGGGWWYYWDSASTAADDGGMVLQPNSLPAAGRWIGLIPSDRELNVRIYGAVCDDHTDDTAKIVACNAWCYTNKCVILVDTSMYCATNPSLTVKLKLLPGVIFRYGNFNPTLDVVIDANDKTQHFNCTITYIPTLITTFVYCEWFGEEWSASHPITTAVLAAIVLADTTHPVFRMMTNVYVHESLYVNSLYPGEVQCSGVGHFNGKVTGQSFDAIDIVDGAIGLKIGADGDSQYRNNNTDKYGNIAHPHYSNSALSVVSLSVKSAATESIVAIGGPDSGSYNSATKISLRTCATNTGGAATERMSIASDGSVVVGSPTGGAKGAGTINAVAVYDDNVQLTGYVFDKAFNPEFDIEDWGKKAPAVKGFIDRVDLMLNIDEYCGFIKSRRMLPTFEDVENSGNIPSTGAMIQKLWEVVEIQSVHIGKLNERIKLLEKK